MLTLFLDKASALREITQGRHANMFIFVLENQEKKVVKKYKKKVVNTAMVLSGTVLMIYFAMTLMVNRRGQGGFLIQLRREANVVSVYRVVDRFCLVVNTTTKGRRY